jgi:biotin carboxylase
MTRVLIVLPSASYRVADFVAAGKTLRVEAVIATDAAQVMASDMAERLVRVDPRRPEWSAGRIVEFAQRFPLDAVVAADDDGVVMAAVAARELGLPHNPPEAVRATRDKAAMRGIFADAALPQPSYRVIDADDDPFAACAAVGFPCVLKPVSLTASRGVIRVDDTAAVSGTVAWLQTITAEAGRDPAEPILAEAFVAGTEVALEGLLVDGNLEVLALFDKPDPMNGPYFEETILVTPSRLDRRVQDQIVAVASAAAAALGLVQGPVHAEARIRDGRVWLLEVAARSIGGLCGRSLRFGLLGTSLEATLLRSALGYRGAPAKPQSPASGVMMLPIARAGTLSAISGHERATAVPGIVDLELTIPIGSLVRPPPEADRYLGFLFARGHTPQAVEESLRRAHAELIIDIR